MLFCLETILLVLAAHSASAGVVRRFFNTTSLPVLTSPSLPPIFSASSITDTWSSSHETTVATSAATPGLPPTTTSSTLITPSGVEPGRTSSPSSIMLSNSTWTSTTYSTSLHIVSFATNSQTVQGAPQGSPTSARSARASTTEITSTITFTSTKTILPPSQANATQYSPGVASHPTFPTGGKGSPYFKGTGFHHHLHSSTLGGSVLSNSPSSAAAAQSSQPIPITASFVLGSSTLQVTVSQGRGNAPSGIATISSQSTTTVHLTRMSTILFTTTATKPRSPSTASVSGVHPGRPHAKHTVNTRSTTSNDLPVSTFPTNFPSFTFHPTRSTKIPSQQTLSSPSSSSLNSATSSALAGITIVPVDPDATTVFMTITQTDAAFTTTVAQGTTTVTVHASQSAQQRQHWRWQGREGGREQG